MQILKKAFRIFFRIILFLLGLIFLLYLLIQTSPVQNFLAGKATAFLSREFKTEVSLKKIGFSLLDKVDLEGFMIRDRQKDTLLYAGSLKVRITDWFIFKKQIELKYIGLEDAVIKQQRTDSVWNYQFLADYFSQQPKPKKEPAKIALNLKKLDLKNVLFVKDDAWAGQKMYAKVGSLLLDADKIDLAKNSFQINSIDLDKPKIILENFKGNRPDSLAPAASAPDSVSRLNPGNILAHIKIINITNGYFGSLKRGALSKKGEFNGANIQASAITGEIHDFLLKQDTITAKVSLRAKERSGFELKKLKADIMINPQVMQFNNLDIRTPSSRIGDYYAMHYEHFNADMADFIDRIKISANFRNTTVSSNDIAFFAPALKDWKKEFALNGKFRGTVSDFKADDFFVRVDANSYASGNFSMKGLPDINRTIIRLDKGVVQSNNRGIMFLYPGLAKLKSPDFDALQNVRMQGSFAGTIHDFAINGNFSTALGSFYTNLKLKFPKYSEPEYNGTIQTQQFNLGRFIHSDSLGEISFEGKVDGRSFVLDKIKTTIDGVFSKLYFNGYTYQHLRFNGTMQKQKFDGEFFANDPNFNFTSNIEIDLSGEAPSFNVLGDLGEANFKELHLTHKDFRLTGLFDLNFTGHNIDEFLGSAKILNAVLMSDTTQLDFDSLSVTAYRDSIDRKVLTINSNQFDVSVMGKFSILDLQNSFQSFLNIYYPALVRKPAKAPQNQNFTVTVHTYDFDKYASLIDSRLSGFDSVYVIGSVNTDNKDSGFRFSAYFPNGQYGKYKLKDAMISGSGVLDTLHVTGDISRVYVGDSLYFPNTAFEITSFNNHSVLHLSTSASEKLNEADLNADIFNLDDGVRINFRPSSFVLNSKKWDLEKEGELIIRKNSANATNVKFKQGFQEISIETDPLDSTKGNNLVVKLKDVNIGDFTSLFIKSPTLEGVANGQIYLRDFYGNFNALANLDASQFRLDNDSVGHVQINSQFENSTGKISWKVISDNAQFGLDADGYYNLKDSTNTPINTTLHLKHTRIGFLNRFLHTIFSDLDGFATGDLKMQGSPKSPIITGEAALTEAALTVNYTKVRYEVDSAVILFKENQIDFGSLVIRDKYNNTGNVKGILYETGFKNMRYDFDMVTNKLLLLDTKANDNKQFYGKAIGKATLSLKGPQEDMHMSITGEVNDTTHIYIPTSNDQESTDADFIVFKQYGEKIEAPVATSDTRLTIDLDLTANNQAQIDVILDPLSGDMIEATGNGRLKIKVPAVGNMSMNGRYNIEKGRYSFNFQSLVRRPFDFVDGANNYIEWNGDPFKANLHVDAQYTAKNVSLGTLINNTGLNLGGTVQGYRGDVYVVAELRGLLTKPDINFRFDFPQGSPITNDNNLRLFLNKVQQDDNEMLKQVTWLIIFGSFAPYGEIGTGNNLARSTGINSISQKISNEVNKLVSNLLSKLTGDKSLQFDVSASTYSSSDLIGNTSSDNRLDRQQVNLKLNQSLLNGKVIITFGTGLDFNISNSAVQQGNFQWLPDISVQIILSRDRKLKAIIFNKSSLDVSSGNIGRTTRQGVSITYSIDFPKNQNEMLIPKKAKRKAHKNPSQQEMEEKEEIPE